MKSHPVKRWKGWAGFNQTDPPDRLQETELVELLNAHCDATGRIVKHEGYYPVTMADALGVTVLTGKARNHAGARFRGPSGDQRALAVVGGSILRSGPNNISSAWPVITFPTTIDTPDLDRVAAIVFKARYGYHQNGVDIPFRVEMEDTDGGTGAYEAEVLGLPAPTWSGEYGTNTIGAFSRFPTDARTNYAFTFVYGSRGESGPSPIMSYQPGAINCTGQVIDDPPNWPPGVTKMRVYRSKIGYGKIAPTSSPVGIDILAYSELFFLFEYDAAPTSISDTIEDNGLDYSRRLPPPRPMVPRSFYQIIHQDHFAWANLVEHPWVMFVSSVMYNTQPPGASTLVAAAITISNTGNGTITLKHNIGAGLVTIITISDYKTKTLFAIQIAIMNSLWNNQYDGGGSGSNFVARIAPGVDGTRTFRFRECVDQDIFQPNSAFGLEAIDDPTDAVAVDGVQRFPNRLMWSNVLYPEEVNPLNFVDLNKNDAYPIRGLFRNDFTLGIFTSEHIWLLTGSLSADPVTFRPDFSIAATNSEAGNFCTRPDSIAVAPEGVYFVAEDGLRLYVGGRSKRIARGIDARLLVRILVEPRARDNVSLYYSKGKRFIAYPGMEVV